MLLYDSIQGQCHGGPIVANVANFKVYFLIKRLQVNYDTPRQYLNFN